MATWKVVISAKAAKELRALKNNGELSREDQLIIETWARDIINNGLGNILNSKKWNDHALHGAWAGYRSSSFSFKGRIIYKVEDKKILVEVVRITVGHNYKKGEEDG